MSWYPVSTAFWSASSSWYAARKEAQAKASKLGVGKMERKEATWQSRGAHYLRGRSDLKKWFKASDGTAFMVRVDPKLARDILNFVEQLNPSIVRAFDEHLGHLAFNAWRDWPVRTGLSKSLIGLEYMLNGEERFVGQIVVTAPYVFFIEGSPHRALLEKPAGGVGLRMATDILAALKKAV